MAKVTMSDTTSGTHGDSGIKLTILELGLNDNDHILIYNLVSELRATYNPMFTFRVVVDYVGYGINVYIPGQMCNRSDIILDMGMDIQVLLNKYVANHE